MFYAKTNDTVKRKCTQENKTEANLQTQPHSRQ